MKNLKKYLLLGALILTLVFCNVVAANAIPVDKQFINKNRSYRDLSPIGLTIHDTCDEGATAQNAHDYFTRESVGASAHYFVDWFGVIQTVPTNEQAWHAGSYANQRYLSIEMCNPRVGNQEQFNEVYRNTVSLAVDLCKKYNWDASNIVSHKYISNTYHQTDHEDPDAFLEQYGKSWNQLIADISATLKATNGVSSNIGYVVTNYLPVAYKGYDGVDINYVLQYFNGVKCYIKHDDKGIWIETQYLSKEKCQELRNVLGSWFYEIRE